MRKLKLLQEPLWCQFVLGVLGGMEATPENLQYLVRHLPEGALWSATGIGSGHLPILYSAIALGANGVRVGLEDNLYLDRGVPATNAAPGGTGPRSWCACIISSPPPRRRPGRSWGFRPWSDNSHRGLKRRDIPNENH